MSTRHRLLRTSSTRHVADFFDFWAVGHICDVLWCNLTLWLLFVDTHRYRVLCARYETTLLVYHLTTRTYPPRENRSFLSLWCVCGVYKIQVSWGVRLQPPIPGALSFFVEVLTSRELVVFLVDLTAGLGPCPFLPIICNIVCVWKFKKYEMQ